MTSHKTVQVLVFLPLTQNRRLLYTFLNIAENLKNYKVSASSLALEHCNVSTQVIKISYVY